VSKVGRTSRVSRVGKASKASKAGKPIKTDRMAETGEMAKDTPNHVPANKEFTQPEWFDQYAVWTAGELAASETVNNKPKNKATGLNAGSGVDTGHSYFNQQLTDGGWPRKGVIEVVYDRPGTGELSLLLSLLRYYSQGERWLLWIAPPFQLHIPALRESGVDSKQLLQIAPTSIKDRLWCTEEALKSGAVSLVLSWPGRLKPEHVRRLQIISNQHRVPCVLFREQGALNTPCALRIHIGSIDQSHARIHILKRQRGWSPPPFTLPLRHCPVFRYPLQASSQPCR